MNKMSTNLKSVLTSILIGTCLLGTNRAVAEEKLTKGYYTMDSLGCMVVRECTDGVVEIKDYKDIAKHYKKFPMTPPMSVEFDEMMVALKTIGVKVYIAPEKYFPVGHRGVYHTITNNFYLNETYVKRYNVLMTVMRHEGWHSAQDCMAGTIKNSMIALILPEESVPKVWRDIVEKSYPKAAVPFEAEAKWAGMTEGMTMKALKACAAGEMWKVYEPTPLTKKWLQEEGYID